MFEVIPMMFAFVMAHKVIIALLVALSVAIVYAVEKASEL